MKKYIIGISGHKQSGKSTLAEFLQGYIGREPEVAGARGCAVPKVWNHSFADALKEFCVNCLGLSHEQCYGTDEQKNTLTPYLWENMPFEITKKYSKQEEYEANGELRVIDCPPKGQMTARQIMQVYGTDVMRNFFSQNIWVNATMNKINQLDKMHGGGYHIIADVRFESEVEAVIKNGGFIIRLNRIIEDGADAHESETALDKFDFASLDTRCLIINNQGQDMGYKNQMAMDYLGKIEEGVV